MKPTARTTTNSSPVAGADPVAGPGEAIPELFRRIRLRHGHYCPMSTLGGRLGEAALRHLSPERAVRARYLDDTCAVDGIATATGWLPEAGRLLVRRAGRHRLEVWDTGGGCGIGVELTAAALARAAECRRRQEAGADAEVAASLAALRCAPLAELVAVERLTRWEDPDA